MPIRLLAAVLLATLPAWSAKRILYITHSAGFRHDSIAASIRSMNEIGRRTAAFEVIATEDLRQITGANLAGFDALFFFTSGELALSDSQKRDVLDFVRSGKGFGGAHSATDTLYTWEPYGEMIGGYFDGHPWVEQVTIDVEDPRFPGFGAVGPRFRMVEEIYQFRAFSRDRVRVLLSLDPDSVNLNAPGVNRADRDFALAWCRNYGQGRVFYTALGHFDGTWLDSRFQSMLEGALLWLIGDREADAAVPAAVPTVPANGVGSPVGPATAHAPGSVVAIYGEGLTSGASWEMAAGPLPRRLTGTRVEVDGRPVPLYSAAPGQINAQLPYSLEPGTTAQLRVVSGERASAPVPLAVAAAAPALIAGARSGNSLVLFATGLGALEFEWQAGAVTPLGPLVRTREAVAVWVNGQRRESAFAGLAPTLIGAYQINVAQPAGASGPAEVELETAGVRSNRITVR